MGHDLSFINTMLMGVVFELSSNSSEEQCAGIRPSRGGMATSGSLRAHYTRTAFGLLSAFAVISTLGHLGGGPAYGAKRACPGFVLVDGHCRPNRTKADMHSRRRVSALVRFLFCVFLLLDLLFSVNL